MSGPAHLSLDALDDFPLPITPHETDKNARGRALVVGGGAWGPGAPLLTALAVLRAGAGKVQIAAAERFAPALALAIPEAAIVTVPSTPDGELAREAADVLAANAERADAVVVGPGMLDEATGAYLARRLAAGPGEAAFVLDAGALTALSPDTSVTGTEGRLVITPHAGEMASLLGCHKDLVEADPLAAAREVAKGLSAVVVMKGAETHVVSPDGATWLHRDGVVGLATSGSGDVLAGIVAGLLARGAPPLTAAAWGVCVHARAGRNLSERIAPTGFLAREVLDEIPGILARGG
jgi:ADP-dependent NAD(P)H-hydrate dehydratase